MPLATQKPSRKGKDKVKKEPPAKVIAIPVEKPRKDRGHADEQVWTPSACRPSRVGVGTSLCSSSLLVRCLQSRGGMAGGDGGAAPKPEKQTPKGRQPRHASPEQ